MSETIDSPSVVNDTENMAWRPGDLRSRCEWAEDNVEPPNSARRSKFSISATPWLREPLDWSSDNRVREQVLMMPTGAGKTTMLDVIVPHAVAEDPGGILLVLQTDQDAREYVEERMMPILRGVKSVAHILATMHRHSIRGDAVMFPHMPLYMGGANLTNLQRKSVRYCLGDEVWRWKHGYVKELRARHHDRWNARVVLVSQGGVTHLDTQEGRVQTEWEEAWMRTDRREWCFECPECGEVQRYSWKCLRYDAGDPEAPLDETAIAESASYRCAGTMREPATCDAIFTDALHIRRALANSGRYVVQHPRHLARHHGWHCNALTLYYVPWGQLAIEHAQAHRARKLGDTAPIRIFRQKRSAENYREEEELPATSMKLSPYSWTDYADGQEWEGESLRILTIDVQRAHFWALVRAWRRDGSSRLLWFGKVNTWESLREVQAKYKVQSKWVLIDQQYDTDEVLNRCAEYNEFPVETIRSFPSANHWARAGWTALQGDKASRYRHTPPRGSTTPNFRFYSPYSFPRGSRGFPAAHVFWSSLQVKRIMQKYRDGYRHSFEAPHDVGALVDGPESQSYLSQMFGDVEVDSASKLTGKVTRIFKKVRQHNHAGDLEAEQIVGAMLAGILRAEPTPHEAAAEEPAPEPIPPPLVN